MNHGAGRESYAGQVQELLHTRLRLAPRLLGPVGEVVTGGQGLRGLIARHPLLDW